MQHGAAHYICLFAIYRDLQFIINMRPVCVCVTAGGWRWRCVCVGVCVVHVFLHSLIFILSSRIRCKQEEVFDIEILVWYVSVIFTYLRVYRTYSYIFINVRLLSRVQLAPRVWRPRGRGRRRRVRWWVEYRKCHTLGECSCCFVVVAFLFLFILFFCLFSLARSCLYVAGSARISISMYGACSQRKLFLLSFH